MYATLQQRRDAREAVSHPGKFESEDAMVPILYAITMDGFEDDYADFGTDGYVDHYARVGRWILHTSDSGFVSGTRFDHVRDAEDEITRLADHAAEYEESDLDEFA